jgi:hypothetical protein
VIGARTRSAAVPATKATRMHHHTSAARALPPHLALLNDLDRN